MNILITGGAGFIGSHLVEHYQDRPGELRVLDNLRTGSTQHLSGLRHTLIEDSITDPAAVTRAMEGIDLVFHLAALVSVPESVADPAGCVTINVHGLLEVLEAARAAGVRKVVLASSAAVYGDDPAIPTTEAEAPDPRSPYAMTKLDGEFYLDLYRREHGLETAALRLFNVFGPRQDPAGTYAAAVPRFIQQALAGEALGIHGDGGQTRDFIFVRDVVRAFAFVAETPGLTGVFNAGLGAGTSIRELAGMIVEATGSGSGIVHGPVRPGDVRHSHAGTGRLRRAGWSPTHSLREGLAATIEDFRARGI